jgi:hypothetical protein
MEISALASKVSQKPRRGSNQGKTRNIGKVGYPWVICFFTNMSVAEVQKLAEASNDHNPGLGLNKTKYTSPAALSCKAGVLSVAHFHGIRLCTEIASLMDAFRQSGIDVYVSTASLEDVVAVFATTPKYAYHVKRGRRAAKQIQERLAIELGPRQD